MITDIFLDCDGVLFDFTNHALRAHGAFDKRDTMARGEYSIGKLLGWTEGHFWGAVDNPTFWNTLPEYPGAVDFLEAVIYLAGKAGATLSFCTSSSRNVGAFTSGRDTALDYLWFEANDRRNVLSPTTYYCANGASKGVFGSPGRLLVDDSVTNCEDFRKRGGIAIMPEMPWNCLDPKASYDGPDYDKLLEQIKKEIG